MAEHTPVLPMLSPFEQLLSELARLEDYAREHHIDDASNALRNMRVALSYQKRQRESAAKATV